MGEEKRQASAWLKKRRRLRLGHRESAAGCEEQLRTDPVGSLTSPSEVHRLSFLGQAAACRNVCGRDRWAKRRDSLRTGRREAAAGCRGAFEGGTRGYLTSPSKAHKISSLSFVGDLG